MMGAQEMEDEAYVSVDEMAEYHGADPHTIRRVLWRDQDKPEEERAIPGARKVGGKYRGEWRIPLESALQWVRGKPGRPRRDIRDGKEE